MNLCYELVQYMAAMQSSCAGGRGSGVFAVWGCWPGILGMASAFFLLVLCLLRVAALKKRVLSQARELAAEFERRQCLEAVLLEQQRFAAIGSLANGIAHDISNPIMGVMNYALLIRDELDAKKTPEPAAYASAIVAEIERVSVIVRNLLSYWGQKQAVKEAVRLGDLVEKTVTLFRTTLRHDYIELDVVISDNDVLLFCCAQQIRQVLINLFSNARESLNVKYPDRDPNKRMRITVTRLNQDELGYADGVLAMSADTFFVRITIEDSGVGISTEMIARVFEPFFTTKPRDQKAGLGLAVSLAIVKEHGGMIQVESEPGQGARFHVDLPLMDANDNTGVLV